MPRLLFGSQGNDLEKAVSKIVGPTHPGIEAWMVTTVMAKGDVRVDECGEGGIEEMYEAFDDAKEQFGLLRQRDATTGVHKLFLICWCGEGVPPMNKAPFNSHVQDARLYFKGKFNLEIIARNRADVDPKNFRNSGQEDCPKTLSSPALNNALPSLKDRMASLQKSSSETLLQKSANTVKIPAHSQKNEAVTKPKTFAPQPKLPDTPVTEKPREKSPERVVMSVKERMQALQSRARPTSPKKFTVEQKLPIKEPQQSTLPIKEQSTLPIKVKSTLPIKVKSTLPIKVKSTLPIKEQSTLPIKEPQLPSRPIPVEPTASTEPPSRPAPEPTRAVLSQEPPVRAVPADPTTRVKSPTLELCEKYSVVYEFEGTDENDMKHLLVAGTHVQLVESFDDGWCSINANGLILLFPFDYLCSLADCVYVSTYDFVAAREDELSMFADERLVGVDCSDPEWWHGTIEGSDRSGYFPSTYVRKLE